MGTTPPRRSAFVGSIPSDYDSFLGPFLFEFYAADLAARLDVPAGGAILETACGTGISTEHLRRALRPDVSIVATDLSEPMLAVAQEKRGQLENVRYELASATELPYKDRSFDAVCCQFGLMFVEDKELAMREARRVLRPGGRLIFNVWGAPEANPFVELAQRTIDSFFDSDPPGFLRLPWSYSALGAIEDLLVGADFADVALHVVSHVCERPTAEHVAIGLVRGNPNIIEVTERANASVEEVVAAVAKALGDAFGAAPLRVPQQAIVATGRRVEHAG